MIIINFVSVFFFLLTALCLTSVTNLGTACENLAGDAVLFSLFRSGAPASPCPIRGPLEFTYSLGGDGKECSSTSSFAETCTQDSRLLLRYLACPEVSNTESTGNFYLFIHLFIYQYVPHLLSARIRVLICLTRYIFLR